MQNFMVTPPRQHQQPYSEQPASNMYHPNYQQPNSIPMRSNSNGFINTASFVDNSGMQRQHSNGNYHQPIINPNIPPYSMANRQMPGMDQANLVQYPDQNQVYNSRLHSGGYQAQNSQAYCSNSYNGFNNAPIYTQGEIIPRPPASTTNNNAANMNRYRMSRLRNAKQSTHPPSSELQQPPNRINCTPDAEVINCVLNLVLVRSKFFNLVLFISHIFTDTSLLSSRRVH